MTDTTAHDEARIAALLHALTLEEKISLLAGASMWTTAPIERLGIPAMKVSDGPNGARGGGSFTGGTMTSACFPVGIALASTWNTALIEQVGQALAEEAQTKGAQMVLAPTVNIHRSPLNGRNFECYSEDPYLTARIAVAYITGLQSRNIGATVKHFVCNDSEFERNTISSDVDERTMREIYLPPFQAAVQEAKTWGVMASYNKVNGVFASENAATLSVLLKQEWGFDGIVMSDWFGTKSTAASINNGLDLEMPGPPIWRGSQVLDGVKIGNISIQAIEESTRRILRILLRSGVFEHPATHPEQSMNTPAHRVLIRATSAESIVLLKNVGDILPLHAQKLKTIAVIGPNAKTAQIMGGGSAQVNAHYSITPYAGIAAQVGDNVRLTYEIGCTNHKLLPRLDTAYITTSDSTHQFTLTYYNTLDLSGDPVYEAPTSTAEQLWLGAVAPSVQQGNFSARMTASFTPQENGMHSFSLASAGLSRLLLDGRIVLDNWTQQTAGDTYFGMGSTEITTTVELLAGHVYALAVEYSSQDTMMLAGVRLGYLPPVTADALERAATLAANADVALLFVGLNGGWEAEGYDRPNIALVGEQVALIERVAAANPHTIVVLQTGSPIEMPWLDKVAGVLQAWYGGQECGNAIADVLFGAVNPSGKLPQTFPQRLEDNPAYINYPGEHGHVRYGEGIFVGYRYYEKKRLMPLFPFGFGLSYTSFAYNNLLLSPHTLAPNVPLTISIDVTNTGQHTGKECVQVYVRDIHASVTRPPQELKGFAKVELAPAETQTVMLTLDLTTLAYWDDEQHAWVAEAGEFEIRVGSSSQDIRASATFQLTQTSVSGKAMQA